MRNLYIILILLLFIQSKSILKNKKHSYSNIIRNLWEEDMEYTNRNISSETDSLKICAKSNYKYFSFILNGAPVNFEHYVNQENAVSKNINIFIKI